MLKELGLDMLSAKRVSLLKNVPLFADLTDEELLCLIQHFKVKRYERNEIIFHQGDVGQEFFIILNGKVRIVKVTPSGDETTIAIFSKFDIFGEFAVVDGKPRSATARVTESATLLALGRDVYNAYCLTVPQLATGMTKLLANKLRWLATYAEAVAQYDVAARLLHILLLYNEKFGQAQDGGNSSLLDLSMKQAELASLVGTRREWVSRILQDWRGRGLIEYNSGKIIFLDLSKVKAERDRQLALHSAVW